MLVIFIHISSEIILEMPHSRQEFWNIRVASRLSGFVVQGFILLSGVKFFLHYAERIRYGRFYLMRFLHIVVPYILWVLFYYLYFCYRGEYSFSFKQLGRFILTGEISAQFYFIVILLQFYLLAPLWRWLLRRANPAVAVLISLMVTILFGQNLSDILAVITPNRTYLYLDRIFPRYLLYWTAGCMIGLHYEAFQEYLRRRWLSITILFLLCAAGNGWFTVICVDIHPSWMDGIQTLYCISALLFFYALSQIFVRGSGVLLRLLQGIDRASYAIYLVHCLVLFMINDYMNRRGMEDLMTRFWIRAALVYGISVLGCVLWGWCKYKIAYLIKKT